MSEQQAKQHTEVLHANLYIRRTLPSHPDGGARRDRTDDLMLAKHALSQLSYGPGYPVGGRQRNGGPG